MIVRSRYHRLIFEELGMVNVLGKIADSLKESLFIIFQKTDGI